MRKLRMRHLYLYSTNNLAINPELPDNILNHVNKYKHEKKRLISMSMYYYLAKELKNLGFDIASLKFTPLGKPYLDGIYISMSHTASYFGFILSATPVGLDLEEIIKNERLGLSKRVLNPSELNEFEVSIDKALYLTSRWTIKEAYSKYLGTGLKDSIFNEDIEGLNLYNDNLVIGIYPNTNDINLTIKK